MSIGLAFFHGWGLDHRFWAPLRHQLAELPQVMVSADYFDPTPTPDWQAAEQWIAVGHSLGWAKAIARSMGSQSNPPWLATVSLCGFTRFCAHSVDQSGQAKRVVDRMVRAFSTQPATVLSDFLTRCGLTDLNPLTERQGYSASWKLDRLTADLITLRDIDINDEFMSQEIPTLCLASSDDVIVTPPLTEACFGTTSKAELIWHTDGGHALGYLHADWCAGQIKRFMKEHALG